MKDGKVFGTTCGVRAFCNENLGEHPSLGLGGLACLFLHCYSCIAILLCLFLHCYSIVPIAIVPILVWCVDSRVQLEPLAGA